MFDMHRMQSIYTLFIIESAVMGRNFGENGLPNSCKPPRID